MSETLELGTLPKGYISFSAYAMYLRCARQYQYRYLENRVEPPKGALILGKGTHKGLEWASKEHIATSKPPPLSQVREAAAAGVEAELKAVPESEIVFDPGDNGGKLKDASVSLVNAYDHIRQSNQPEAVERRFELTFSNTDYKMVGIVDLETKDDRLIDWKTTKKSYSPTAAATSEQLTSYGIQNANAKSLELHVMVRTKEPKVQVLTSPPRTPEQVGELLQNVAKVAVLIKAGIFPKVIEAAPGSPCSWCGYYEACRGKKRSVTTD